MHILIASDADISTSIEHAESGEPASWVVPKTAHIGDICILSHMGHGLYATALLKSEPQHDSTSVARSSYRADISEIDFLGEMLPHSVLVEAFPNWKWPTYPRSYTTVPEEIEDALWEIVSEATVGRPMEVDASVSSEGASRLLIHFVTERDAALAERKKRSVLAANENLGCEVCGFDFETRYGALGSEFCEVHHLKPIAGREGNEPTMLEELAVVCSNCHRMLHRRGLISVAQLKVLLL